MIEALAGAIAGGVLGFISSNFLWKRKILFEKNNIARGFFLELGQIKEYLEDIPIAMPAKNPCNPEERPENVYVDIFERFSKKGPIYRDNGLYFLFKKEISSFENDIADLLLSIYPRILMIEKFREDPIPSKYELLDPFDIGPQITDIIEKIDETRSLLQKKYSID